MKNKELEEMTRDELYEMAKEREIPGKSSMTKEELIKALGKEGKSGGQHKSESKHGSSKSESHGSHHGGQKEKDPAPKGAKKEDYKNIPGNQT